VPPPSQLQWDLVYSTASTHNRKMLPLWSPVLHPLQKILRAPLVQLSLNYHYNNKSITCFLIISLGRTAYVVSKPPKGAQKRKITVFRIKLNFSRRKSALKFLRAKKLSAKVVRYSLACLTANKWLMGGRPLKHKVSHQLAGKRHHRFGNPRMPYLYRNDDNAV